MIRNRLLLKSFAAFFIIEMVASIIAPSISWALTAGPTAPEFSSFEPVDTTDMVNLATGDFVYNTPILEVPGPEGGYPLSLSYHAGILNGQESSWVGLGFTLNAGAINRTVDGYADDNFETKKQIRDYWGGGESFTKTFAIGKSFGGVSLSYSLAETRDTYKGFSTHSAVGVSIDPVKALLSLLTKGNSNASFQRGINTASTAASEVGESTGESSLGITIDSKGVKTNLSLFGVSMSERSNYAGNISSFSREEPSSNSDFLAYQFNYQIKNYYTRYWSDEAQALTTYGALYPGEANKKIGGDFYANSSVNSEFTTYAFDTYNLFDTQPLDLRQRNTSLVDDNNDAIKQLGGTLPAYDHYAVLGQGIGGMMQPFIFENGDLYGQDLYERGFYGEPVLNFANLEYKSLKKFSDKKVDFRFLNDFSNSLSITPSDFKTEDGVLSVNPHSVQADSYGFNNLGNNQKLAGSKHIEWFTNEEIVNGDAMQAGFVDFYATKSDRQLIFDVYQNYLQPEEGLPNDGNISYGTGSRSYVTDNYESAPDPYQNLTKAHFYSLKPKSVDLRKKIGGFKITNESGVTYHYALPVYNYNEYTRSKVKKPIKGTLTFTEHYNNDPYAYTWLLTAITGPDFVDKNVNGILDDQDWGYWVKFDYGRWADAYQWRTPHTGYAANVEESNVTFSYGIKELYYLDAIETRSHKAIFIKSKRKDGKGVTSRLEGGSNPRQYKMHFASENAVGDLRFVVSPVSTMKLDAIYLFRKDDLLTIQVDKTTGERYNEATSSRPHAFPYKGTPYSGVLDKTSPPEPVTIKNGEDFVYVKYHNGDLVYDDDDISTHPEFRKKALRIVEFNTDYSLAQGVPNSIGYFSDFSNRVGCVDNGQCDKGLDSRIGLDFEWPMLHSIPRSCIDIAHGIAPICCKDNENFYSKDGIFEIYNGGDTGIGNCPDYDKPFPGNVLEYFPTGKLTLNSIKFLGRGGADLMPATTFNYDENKNPDYSDKYDDWGYYKSDYDLNIKGHTRRITKASSASIDAWSLTSVTSTLGSIIQIEHEPNQYQKSIYNDFSTFSIEKLQLGTGENQVKIFFNEKKLKLSQWFSVGKPIDMKAFIVYNLYRRPFNFFEVESETFISDDSETIVDIQEDMIVIESESLKELLTRKIFSLPIYGRGSKVGNEDCPSFPFFVSGFIKAIDPSPLKYTGGVRVRSLTIINDLNKSKVLYEYNMPGTNNSSGITSYKPFNETTIQCPVDENFFEKISTDEGLKKQRKKLLSFQNGFQELINEPYKKILGFTREAPAPGSIYEYVKVRNFSNDIEFDAYSLHHFKVFDESMVVQESTTSFSTELETRNLKIKNNTVDVGNILSIDSYNLKNELVESSSYGYLYDDNNEAFEQNALDSKQGFIEQSFHKYITLTEYNIDTDLKNWFQKNIARESDTRTYNTIYKKSKAIVTTRQDRSNAVTSVKKEDHIKGIVTLSQNHAFDFYSGQVTKTMTHDSYGNTFMSITEPAREHYPAMGLKIFNPLNSHMLTQAAATYNYKVNDAYEPIGLLQASIQTWTDQTPVLDVPEGQQNVWRKGTSYQWNGQLALDPIEGTYPYNDFSLHPFTNWNNASAQQNIYWEQTVEPTLYDVYSHSLEAKDINGNYAAVRMDRKQQKVLVGGSNAKYSEIIFAGSESYEGNSELQGSASQGEGDPSAAHTHTGQYSLLVGQGKKGFGYTLTPDKADLTKKYRASVWVYVPGESETQVQLDKLQLYYTINDKEQSFVHPILQKSKSKSWYLLNLDVVPKGDGVVFIGVRNNAQRGAYFDDFRVHPLACSLISYIYDAATGEVNFILDGNNFYTRFEYDAMGRLIRSSKELLNFDFGDGKESFRADAILKEMKYNYGKSH